MFFRGASSLDKMKVLTVLLISHLILGIRTQTNPPGSCSNDGVCSALWETEGDVIIGIIANFHTDSVDKNVQRPCSTFQAQEVELVEAVRWLLDSISEADYIPGIKIGVKVYDACDRTDITSTSAISMLPYLRYANTSTPKPLIGILGILTSSQAQHLVDTLEDTNVPLVSPTASAPSLSQSSHFFRTIPSDELQMKILYNLIKSLQMKYIAVVYSDDQFGHQGIKEIERHVEEDGHQVCIATSTSISSRYEAFHIINNLVTLQENLNQKNLPVLFIGQYIDARLLIQATGINDDTYRLLWIFPDSIGVDASLFKENEKVGRNSLSVSPFYNVIDEFRTFWTRKLYKVVQGASDSVNPPYYEEYLENLLSCSVTSMTCKLKTAEDINQTFSQSSYMNTVLNSALALAKAVKILHSNKCGSVSGLCPDFEKTLRSVADRQIIDILQSISINSTSEESLQFLPTSIQEISSFQFESDGNLGIGENQNIYLIHNAKCQPNCVFEIVGMATKDSTNLDLEAVTLYLDHRSKEVVLGSQLPSIYCMKNCEDCEDKFRPNVQYASIWGENLIAAFVPVHKPGESVFSCGSLNERQTIEDVEALLYGIETFNNNTGPWKGKPLLSGHLGIIVFDSCQNPLHAASTLLQWFSGVLKIYNRLGQYFDPKTCVGIIGGLYSATNLQILPISQKEFLLQIGYASSSLGLPLNSSEFMRTIPADDIQAQAIVDLVKKMEFNAFSVLYVDDSYGYNGYRQLVLKAEEAKLCINKAIELPRHISEQGLSDIFAMLQDAEETRVVVVFSGAAEADLLLKTANKKSIKKKFIYIGSEAWGVRSRLIDAESGNEALGLFVVDFPRVTNFNYTTYMTRLRPEPNSRDMFLREWWENQFQCRVPSSAIPNPPNKCSDSLSIPPPSDVQTAILVMKAVWTMALGLSSAFTKICSDAPLTCASKIRNKDAREIIAQNVRSSTLLRNGQQYRVYSKRGDGDLTEELWNVQKMGLEKKFVKVAEFTKNRLTILNSTNIKFYNIYGEETDRPSSTCFQCNCIYKHPEEPLIKLSNNMVVYGQIYIIALLPFHRSILSSDIDTDAVLWSESLAKAVKRVNNNIFGKDMLGLLVYDSYGDKDVASLQTILAMDAGRYLRLKNYDKEAYSMCLLTYGTGLDSVYANLALKRDMIHLNFGQAVSSLLTTSQFFYNLGITLEDELAVLIATAKHYGWSSLKLVHSNTEESIYAKDEFLESAKQNGLCSIEAFTLELFVTAMRINRIQSPVIVLFIDDNELIDLLNELGSKMDGKYFMAWSKLTRSLSYIGGNSYKSVLNSTIGVSLHGRPTNMNKTLILQNVNDHKMIDNPWLEESVDLAKALDESQSGIEHIEHFIDSFADALRGLMLAVCGNGNRLCEELMKLPDWNTNRLLWFMKKGTNFSQAIQQKNRFFIKSFQLQSLYNDRFVEKEVGIYDSDSTMVEITDAKLNSIYENVKSKCRGENCDSCRTSDITQSFPGWVIFLIILVIGLAALVIAMMFYIWQLIRSYSEKERQRQSDENVYCTPLDLGDQVDNKTINTVGYSQVMPGVSQVGNDNTNASDSGIEKIMPETNMSRGDGSSGQLSGVSAGLSGRVEDDDILHNCNSFDPPTNNRNSPYRMSFKMNSPESGFYDSNWKLKHSREPDLVCTDGPNGQIGKETPSNCDGYIMSLSNEDVNQNKSQNEKLAISYENPISKSLVPSSVQM